MTVDAGCFPAGRHLAHHAHHLLLTLRGQWARDTQQPQVVHSLNVIMLSRAYLTVDITCLVKLAIHVFAYFVAHAHHLLLALRGERARDAQQPQVITCCCSQARSTCISPA
jgi:hypothetical protein